MGDPHEARAQLLATLERMELGDDEALSALHDVEQQLRDKQLIRATAALAGYEIADFGYSADLELYFVIKSGHREDAYLAKGWEDPGFRIGEVTNISAEQRKLRVWLDELREFAATRGIATTTSRSETGTEIRLECVVYRDGFTPQVLSGSLASIRECHRKVQEREQGLIAAALRTAR